MPGELDINTATGQKAVFVVGEAAWHREGFRLDHPPTYDEALRLSGADYDVETLAAYFKIGDEFIAAPNHRAIVRRDRRIAYDFATKQYQAIQNREAFEILKPLIDRGVAVIETGGALREGRDAWLLVRLVVDDPVVQEVFGSEVCPYIIITTNHTRNGGVVVMFTPIRVVCANTLAAAHNARQKKTSITVSHRTGASVRLVEAAEKLFAGVVDRYVRIAQDYADMKERKLTVDEFTSLLDLSLPQPHPDAPKAVLERNATKRVRARDLWVGGIGHTGDHSAWEAYNGFVQMFDHDTKLFKTRGSRVASLLDGGLAAKKQEILDATMVLVRA